MQSGNLSGTRNAWAEAWQPLAYAEGLWTRLLADLLESGRPSALVRAAGVRPLSSPASVAIPRPRFLAGGAGARLSRRFQLPDLLKPSTGPRETSLRDELGSRGAGRGGQDDILTLVVRPDLQGRSWRVTTSRLPGWVEFRDRRGLAVASPRAEVFVPLWPLSQLLEFSP